MNKQSQKMCCDCKEVKSRNESNFYPSTIHADGLNKRCISCQLAYNKANMERYKKRAFDRAKAKKQAKIPFFSKKGQAAHDELTKVKNQIRQEAQDVGNRFCQGCSRGDVGLDCSHILSVKQRSDLQHDKHNINLLCRLCHLKHESGDIKLMLELKCFEKDMAYIYAHDEQKFNKVLFKLLDYVELHPNDKAAKRVLDRLEKIENFEV